MHVKPKFWVMENVPRSKKFLQAALSPGGRLERFSQLVVSIDVFNMEDFGLPQRRKRCLAGNIDLALLKSYVSETQARTLGDVVRALTLDTVRDPLFGIEIPQSELFDHEVEQNLSEEECRINMASKTSHTVYNAMPFPDGMDRSVRTITATCTRVSRESVVIESLSESGKYRRLTVRERACLQGFPIVFQFFGETYAKKLRMIGNAVPPAFSFYIAHAILGTQPNALPKLEVAARELKPPLARPANTPPEVVGRTFPQDRNFRFAIPNLQLKSGVRFELTNSFEPGHSGWEVRFVFGTSKEIHVLPLNAALFERLYRALPFRSDRLKEEIATLQEFMSAVDVARMQDVWSHRGPGGSRPFTVLDRLGVAAAGLAEELSALADDASKAAILDSLVAHYGENAAGMSGVSKLLRNAAMIHAGLLVGALANRELRVHAGGNFKASQRHRA